MSKETLKGLPVILNNCFGDPFFSSQKEDTLSKLDSLKDHKGPIGIITKSSIKSSVIQELKKHLVPNVLIYYSLTGLNENGKSFEENEATFRGLKEIHSNTVMYLRPIIPGRNDSVQNIRRIIDIAQDTGSSLVYGGIKFEGTRQVFLESSNVRFISDYSRGVGVDVYEKTSCAAEGILGVDCATHHIGKPRNLNILSELGYSTELCPEGYIRLQTGTHGDKNFIRFISGSQPIIKNIDTQSNILSISSKEMVLEATSSWFIWARNMTNCINCDYCIILDKGHLDVPINIGCNPVDLLKYD